MHVPDGFLNLPTSAVTGAAAVAGVALALRGARRELDERTAPLAGLTATFVFAAQMVNFPVGAGTSGHLIGGALAAILVGPWTATLCLTVVTVVQALLFADGGLTALGTNVLLLAIVSVWVGWGVARLVLRLLPDGRRAVAWAGAAGALISVPAAALVFCGLYAVGGAVAVPLGLLVPTMLGVHTVIGLGEAAITFGVLTAVAASRPDLIHALRPAPEPELEEVPA
ncbi:energy-coupling factor ABC transporter permease [Propioniciclava soli]|uniref:energy-coupling factor ABC transporter permease n=1 Tax=Propioniciclava soli TaxID=2775081 RepID=UPI001E297FD0